ncbi:MAG: tRNA (adenosine(37)-N6)-dimethylallyltransferase MiaA [Anaerovoracaceae bacterium]|jgi:tRNA dimethylallyltransferase
MEERTKRNWEEQSAPAVSEPPAPDRKIVALCGPTAVGKTQVAIEIAERLDGEIVNCDSMQLYRFMDIGSAKPTPEERARVKHYLVDEIDPREPFSVAKFQHLAKDAIETVFKKGKLPIVSGGTGLYLNALLYDMDFSAPPGDTGRRDELFAFARENGNDALHRKLQELDPAAAARIHPNNVKKVVRAIEAAESGRPVRDFRTDLRKTSDYGVILVGLRRDRNELYRRIDRRVDLLMEQGLVEEVKRLLAMGLTEDSISMKGIGYKEIIGFLEGEYDLAEAVRLVKRNTRHLAKRQMTWLRRYREMTWFTLSENDSEEEIIEAIKRWLSEKLDRKP